MKFLLAFALIGIMLFAGCVSDDEQPPLPPSNNGTLQNNSSIGVPNPAAKFCTDRGYEYFIRATTDYPSSSQQGFCKFPNGNECDEWAFYRGECTDADSFELKEYAGFASDPDSRAIKYAFYRDGKLVLQKGVDGYENKTVLISSVSPAYFAAFAKMLDDSKFETLQDDYYRCGVRGDCPTDGPVFSLSLEKQGKTKLVSIYAPADRPKVIDDAVASLKTIFENATFVEQKPVPTMTKELCESARGSWNECGSACRGAPEGTECIALCMPAYCECGGIAGFACPTGFECTDYLPKGENVADAMGICKAKQ